MADIFISYTQQDREAARQLAAAFEENGWQVFWDGKMPAGRMIGEVVREEINRSRCVVVLWSRRSVRSEWVLDEANRARTRDVLVPVIIDELDQEELPLSFGDRFTVRLDPRNLTRSDAFNRLLRDLRSRLAGGGAARASAAPNPFFAVAENLLREDLATRMGDLVKKGEVDIYSFERGWESLFAEAFSGSSGTNLRDLTMSRFGDTAFQRYNFVKYTTFVSRYILQCEERCIPCNVKFMLLCDPDAAQGENNRRAAIFLYDLLRLKYTDPSLDLLALWARDEPGDKSNVGIMITHRSIVEAVVAEEGSGLVDSNLPFNIYGDRALSRSIIRRKAGEAREWASEKPLPYLQLVIAEDLVARYSAVFDEIWRRSEVFKAKMLEPLKGQDSRAKNLAQLLHLWSSASV